MMASIFQVDAFTDHLFGGNPAAVVPLESWPDDQLLQSVAMENNLAETAFTVPAENGFELRWFTPTSEVALCGHATLATAHVMFSHLSFAASTINFYTRMSGTLNVEKRNDNQLAMSFPSIAAKQSADTELLTRALGVNLVELYTGHYSESEFDYMAVLASQQQVESFVPSLNAISALACRGVIITAAGDGCDFVSRFFAPGIGIDEDPVTGSAHCLLAPYWATVLGKDQLAARQVSSRGGVLGCVVDADRTWLTGRCVDYLQGQITLGN